MATAESKQPKKKRLKRFEPRSVCVLLVVHTSIAMFLALVLFAAYTVRQELDTVLDSLKQQNVTRAQNIALSSAKMLVLGNYDQLEEVLLQSIKYPDTLEITVTDAEGRELSHIVKNHRNELELHYDSAQLDLPAEVKPQTWITDLGHRAGLETWQPIVQGATLGWVRVLYDLQKHEALERSIWINSLIASVIAILIQAVLLLLFMKNSLRALYRAGRFAKNLSENRGEQLPVFRGPIEIEELCKSLNQASLQLFDQNKAIKDTYKKQEIIIESAMDAMIQTDEAGHVTGWNSQAENIFGWSRQEALGQMADELIIPQRYRSSSQVGMRRLLSSDDESVLGKRLEILLLHKNGREFPAEVTISSIRQDGVQEFCGFVRDISERKDAERLLRSSSVLQTAVLNSANFSVIFVSLMGDIQIFNNASEKMLGYGAQEVLQNFATLECREVEDVDKRELLLSTVLNEYGKSTLRQLSSAAHHGAVSGEWTYVRKDGSKFPVMLTVTALTDVNQHTSGFLFVADDLTERNRAERERELVNRELVTARSEAESANKAKSNFLASMSHEIRTPMNGVIGMVEVLQQSSLLPHQMEMVELIRESGISLLGIINDILDFSKIEAGELEIEKAPMSVPDSVEMVCGMLERLAVANEVELTLFVDPAIPDSVMGDSLRLRQVLVNLVGNAIKFSGNKAGGRVSVRAVWNGRDTQRGGSGIRGG